MLNVLFLGSERPGYSEWFTYVGLFRLFGTKVVDYPALDHLWEKPADDVQNYVAQGWLGKEFQKDSVDRSEIKRKIDDGFFQLIVISNRGWEQYHHLVQGQPNVIYLDGEDLPDINIDLLEKENFLLYAKREVLLDLKDDHRILPLPFAFEKEAIPAFTCAKTNQVFGLFHSGSHPFRQEVMAGIAEYQSEWCRIVEPEERVSRQVYFAQMCASKMGLSIRGYGFDTVRFWEVLAAGLPLFSQRPIIKIPSLLKEGKEAVYFDNAGDLRVKLEAFKKMPEKCASIAEAGHAAFLAHHTCAKRAEYLVEHALDARKQMLMRHRIYHDRQKSVQQITPAFASELAEVELNELSEMFPLHEIDKSEKKSKKTTENHPFQWASLVKGHRALMRGKPLEAINEYQKTPLRFFTSLLIEGVSHTLLGNRFKGNILCWKALQQLNLPIVQGLVQQGLSPDAHPERVALLPLISGITLEIGCGARKTSDDVIGIDLLQRGEIGSFGVVNGATSVADFKCSGDNLYFIDDESVDAIILRHNIEHYQDYLKALTEWSRVLKPGGLLGIVLPDDEQLDTIKLDETHKHTFTREGVQHLMSLYPQFTIIELSVLLEKWSFLAVMQKEGGTPFCYADKLQEAEVKEQLTYITALVQANVSFFTPSLLVDALHHCWEHAKKKEKVAPLIVDILLKKQLNSECEKWLHKEFASLSIRNLLSVFFLLSTGKTTEAEQKMQNLSHIELEHELSSYFASLLFNARGQKKEAWSALAQSLQKKPEQLHLLEKFATLTNELQLTEAALKLAKERLLPASESLPPCKQVFYLHFEALLLLALGKKGEALELLHHILCKYPYFEEAKPLLASLSKA